MQAPTPDMLPDVEQYHKLLPIAEKLYMHMDQVAQTLLLPLFLFSVLFAYSQDVGLGGAVVSRIKRLAVVALLLAAFPTLSSLIRDVGQEIALSIDNLSGLDELIKAASTKAKSYSVSLSTLGDFGQSIVTGLMVSFSFLLLFFARFGLVAFYHFYWLVLLVTAPLMILCHLFEATSGITRNLFKNLILVASWPIIWAILSAFLKGLPFVDFYGKDTAYATVAVMNLILVASLLLSPFLLSQFCEGMIVSSGSVISTAAKTVFTKGMNQAAGLADSALKHFNPSLHRSLTTGRPQRLIRVKGMTVALALLGAATASAQETTIQIQPGLSTLLCLKHAPQQAAIGDPRFFRVEPMGKNLILRAVEEDKMTNLIAYFGENLFEVYALKSSKILPHMTRIHCEEPPPVPKKPTPLPKPKIQSVSADGVVLGLEGLFWSGPERDHLTLKIKISNTSSAVLEPDWKRPALIQGGKRRTHSKLWSGRRVIEPKASSPVTIQFTRIGLTHDLPAVLEIPRATKEPLRLHLAPEILK